MLGLLTDGERSGYDLLRAAEQSVGFFWTPAKTQLYAVLRKLVENGFATSRRVRQTDRPDKMLYRITYEGLERLRTGLEQIGSNVNRNLLELRIFYGAHRPERRSSPTWSACATTSVSISPNSSESSRPSTTTNTSFRT